MNYIHIKRMLLVYVVTWGFASFGAAFSHDDAKIIFFNNTSFNLTVEVPGKSPLKVVPGERVTLGRLSDIPGDISYYTYGQWFGIGARLYTVKRDAIAYIANQAGPGIDVLITISTTYVGTYDAAIGLERRSAGQAPLPADLSPEFFFTHARVALASPIWYGWTFEDLVRWRPHFILGLPPEAAKAEVEGTAQRLKDELKIRAGANQGLYNQLAIIVDRAKNNMLRHSVYTPIQMAEFGRQIYRALAQGDASYLSALRSFFNSKFNPEQAESAMVEALVLYFYYIARKLGHVFEEGTFVVYDESGHIYAFLNQLTRKYTRNASHFNGLASVEGKQWLAATGHGHQGYDVDIPAIQKKTILFNRIEPSGSVFYLKPETHGTESWADFIGHAASFVNAQGRKLLPGIFGSDDIPAYSKERVPKELLTRYLAIVEALPESAEEKTRLAQGAVARGVQSMYTEGARLSQKYPESADLKDFVQELLAKSASGDPKFSHLDRRYGAEVVLTPEEFERFKQPIQETDQL